MGETGLEQQATSIKEAAEKVEDGINRVLEPEIKHTQILADDTQTLVRSLSKRVSLLFTLSIALNAVTLILIVLLLT